MQGYIININKAKDEDLIITILSDNSIYTTYRFYGARHSVINLGYKIDFELQHSYRSKIPQLRDVLHLGVKWNTKREEMYLWQQYIQLFFKHLRGIEEIDKFYFDLIDASFQLWDRQNSKRVAIESYMKLLEFEGRLHDDFICFKCEKEIQDEVSLARAFLVAHKECIYTKSYNSSYIRELFLNKSTLFLDDNKVDELWKIMCEGL